MTGSRLRPWLSALVLVAGSLAPLALPSSALAEDIAAAESLFNRGRADMAKGRYETGCKAIAESQRLDPRPGTLFTLAVCEMRWGKLATAAARFTDYLSFYERLNPAERARQKERAKEATAQREALAPLVPELLLVLSPGAPAGTVVKRDDAVLSEASLGVGLPVDPGEHVVTTQAPGGPVSEQRITIGKGEKKRLVLEVKSAREPAAQPVKGEAPPAKAELPEGAAEAEAPTGRRTATYVIGGVGVAGLVLGGVMGGMALGKKGTIGDHCGSAIGEKNEAACDPTGLAAARSGKTFALVSSIGLAAGGAAVGTAVVLLLTEPRRAAKGEAGSKRGLTAGALELGPAGAVVSVRGRW